MKDKAIAAGKGSRPAAGRDGGPRAVTVTDIANAIGVSRATVSLVLRGSPLVNVDTRARVEAGERLRGIRFRTERFVEEHDLGARLQR